MLSIRLACSRRESRGSGQRICARRRTRRRQAVTPPLAIDRREVLKLGGAASIALLAPAGTAPVTAVPRGTASSTIVLADRRYAESVIFAASLERQGARVIDLATDRARTWFDAGETRLAAGLRFLA